MGSGHNSATMSVTLRPNLNFATKADNTSVDWDELKGRLSSFQVDKLNYFFTQFFDHNQDGVIDSKDFAGLNERLRKVADDDEDSDDDDDDDDDDDFDDDNDNDNDIDI